MGEYADYANDDRMFEWELAMDNEFAPLHKKYDLGLCDEDGAMYNPGTPVVDVSNSFRTKQTRKASGKGKCPLCGNKTQLVDGKFGKFYGCNSFPKCKGSRNI